MREKNNTGEHTEYKLDAPTRTFYREKAEDAEVSSNPLYI